MVQINNLNLSARNSNYFSEEAWNNLSVLQKKQLVRNEVKLFCKNKNLPIPDIKFDFLENLYGYTYYNSNNKLCICFDMNLLNDKYKDSNAILLATIHHELKHIEQRTNKNVPLEITLGLSNFIVSIYKNNNTWKSSLYIHELFGSSELSDAVYVLQPCEIEAFSAGNEIQNKTNIKSLEMLNKIKNANDIMTLYFGQKDFVEEIKNSLLTLYDGKPREYSEEIFDLVERCAICSYIDKEDYGVDRISLFLNNKYKSDLLKKKNCEIENSFTVEEELEP